MTQQTAAPVLAHDGDGIQGLIRLLTLEEKVSLLTGKTVWRMHELPRIGLRSVTMSDGPVGVRGLGETEARSPRSSRAPVRSGRPGMSSWPSRSAGHSRARLAPMEST